jgi:hypothetical protein
MRNIPLPQSGKFKALIIGVVAASIFAAAPAKADRSRLEIAPHGYGFASVGGWTGGFGSGFDGGGRVSDYFDQVASADAAGVTIEISGTCASACTMKLGARRVCVHRDAELWFHAAHDANGGFNSLGTRIMMRQYPAGIRAWAARAGALASNDFTTLSGAQAIALGIADCDRRNAGFASQRAL